MGEFVADAARRERSEEVDAIREGGLLDEAADIALVGGIDKGASQAKAPLGQSRSSMANGSPLWQPA